MSDMSRPGPRLPAAPDHEGHDALLVAQFVAGDPLKPEQQAEAQRLVTVCGACAALAVDLPAVSRAVALEPVPPRRRDFRLRPETAAQLRGNAITRFLRGLSLPYSRAFQPAAAGVLSIGLLMVVAGYAWPDGGTLSVQSGPELVERSSASPPAGELDVLWAPSADGLEDQPAAALVEEPEAEDDAPLMGAERAMEASEFADSLADSQAGLAQESMPESQLSVEDPSVTDEAAKSSRASGLQAEPYSTASEAEMAETGTNVDTAQEPLTADGDAAFEQQVQDVAADALEAAPAQDTDGAGAVSGNAAVADDDGTEELLIVLGLALAIGGGGLLLLGWLARRARDPLAP